MSNSVRRKFRVLPIGVTYVKVYQIVNFKYVKFIVWQSYLNKSIRILNKVKLKRHEKGNLTSFVSI